MCQLIFDVKMEFSRNYQMVETRAMNEAPVSQTYSHVVSRYSVCFGLIDSQVKWLVYHG